MPGDLEGSSSDGDLGAASNIGRGEEGSLELLEDLPGTGARARVSPTSSQGGGELGALSNPLGNTWSGARKAGGEPVKREGNGEVIREAGAGGRVRAVVGGMREDGDISCDKWVREKGGRDEEAIEARGPGVGRRGLRGEMEIGKRRVGNLGDSEPGLEGSPNSSEGRRGRGERTGGVLAVLDEVEIATKEGVDAVVDAEHRANEILLGVGLVLTGLKIDVEKLEGLVRRGTGRVAPQLNVALEVSRKGNVGSSVVAKDRRGVYNGGAGFVNLVVIEGNRRLRENGGEGVGLSRGKIGLLKAQDVCRGKKIADGRVDEIATVDKVRGGAVVGKAVDVVGDNAGNRKGKVGEEEERRGRAGRTKRTINHVESWKR